MNYTEDTTTENQRDHFYGGEVEVKDEVTIKAVGGTGPTTDTGLSITLVVDVIVSGPLNEVNPVSTVIGDTRC